MCSLSLASGQEESLNKYGLSRLISCIKYGDGWEALREQSTCAYLYCGYNDSGSTKIDLRVGQGELRAWWGLWENTILPKALMVRVRNVSHSLVHLNTWSQVDGMIWGCIEGMALLEEVCHCGLALRSHGLTVLPVCYLSWLHACCLRSDLWAFCSGGHACLLWCLCAGCACLMVTVMGSYSSGTIIPNSLPLDKLPWSWYFIAVE